MRRASSLALLLPAVLAMLVVGCKSESYFCDDDGCYFCDGLGCRDVNEPDRSECTGDFDCPSGAICTDTGCVVRCTDISDCPAGTDCIEAMCLTPPERRDLPTRTPGTCEVNADCGASGLICRDGMCVPDVITCGEEGCSCEETGLCSDGFVCAAGECRAEDDVCRFNHECGAGRATACRRPLHRRLRRRTAECLEGQTCDGRRLLHSAAAYR